jgi:hypothetical protein
LSEADINEMFHLVTPVSGIAQVYKGGFLYNKGLNVWHNKCNLPKYEKNIPVYHDVDVFMAYMD